MTSVILAAVISIAVAIVCLLALLFVPEEQDETPRCISCGRILWRDKSGNQRCAQRTDEVNGHRQLSEPKRKQIHQTLAKIRKETQ